MFLQVCAKRNKRILDGWETYNYYKRTYAPEVGVACDLKIIWLSTTEQKFFFNESTNYNLTFTGAWIRQFGMDGVGVLRNNGIVAFLCKHVCVAVEEIYML